MLTEPLPTTLDVRKAAVREVTVEGVVALSGMARLREVLASDRGRVEVRIGFARDEENRFVATIAVDAEVELSCQRCLENMSSHLRSEHVLAIVGDDEFARQLPAHLEPWLVEGERGDLWALVEDELILSTPIVSFHESGECGELLKDFQAPPEESVEGAGSPFRMLKRLKPSRH